MTIKSPMFPPRGESVYTISLHPAIGQPESENLTHDSPSPFEDVDLASNVIKFPFGVSRRAHARNDRPKAGSATAENGRLRQWRHEAWRAAEATPRYWTLRLDLQSAVSQAH